MLKYERQGLISMQQDWKLLVVLLGANDLRQVCRDPEASPEQVAVTFADSVNKTLAAARQVFSKVFVALMAVPDVGAIAKFGHSTWTCTAVQKYLEGGHCPDGEPTTSIQSAMNSHLESLADHWSTFEDFAVVYQPFSSGVSLPNSSYLSALDCFHPGEHGHAEMAVALWNSLVSPRKSKKTSLHVGDSIIPSDDNTIFQLN
mmetsp:Transcript_5089/g.7067  ORF Transcript_5089/g.7067 Transcript_5089/m.7067 type:complete len:202 (-) Transcript_5089:76-681(-)